MEEIRVKEIGYLQYLTYELMDHEYEMEIVAFQNGENFDVGSELMIDHPSYVRVQRIGDNAFAYEIALFFNPELIYIDAPYDWLRIQEDKNYYRAEKTWVENKASELGFDNVVVTFNWDDGKVYDKTCFIRKAGGEIINNLTKKAK
jgi:hypothetical protein